MSLIEDEQHKMDSDDDSEYTYVTDDEEDSATKRGWFGFLRRGKKSDEDEEEEYESDVEDISDNESIASGDHQEEEEEEEDNVAVAAQGTTDKDDDNSTTSSEEDILSQIDKYNPTNKEEEDEESILMAEAIQRVQQRIQSHGGNIYDALETKDQQLVDKLRGVEDQDVIRELVSKAMDDEEKAVNKGVVEEEESVEHGYQSERDKQASQQPYIEHGVYVEDGDLVSNINSNGGGTSNDEVKTLEQQSNGDSHKNEEEHLQSSDDDEEEGEEDEEEGPTLEEQRSLLSLAAEHDRVDVIKELLSISQNDEVNTSLLFGFSSANETNTTDSNKINEQGEEENENVTFVPPPLHAAVAHGSVNAASCLLRMGADPSIRPLVPAPYLSRHYQPSPNRRTRSSMEEDRNYKKYHEMSAWELAFGAIVVLEDDDENVGDINDTDVKEEEVTEKRGWFGFSGGGHKKEDESEDFTIQQQKDANGKQRIVRRRQPLNIAPQKLEGIRHAFTAEALRAIGADEVDRLQQLLESGMDSKMEVAGKSLSSWAIEMEADRCSELLCGDVIKSSDEVLPSDSGESSYVVANASDDVDHPQPPTKPLPLVDQHPTPTPIHNERLAGLSPKDILMLIQENENLIPALTACRDDLAEETSACQNILRDVQASGGRGGLSSRSLLDLVHSLKEKRRDLEESVEVWRHAWEEREDELDFFWEEVLNDEWREHLMKSGILDDVTTDAAAKLTGLENTASLDDLTRRFCEVDNRVNTLRSSIASLAEECARYQAEVESAGMSGALSLTKSLREELKETEKHLFEAKSGEAMCRKKLELIQERLTNATKDEQPQEYESEGDIKDEEGTNSSLTYQEQNGVSNITQNFDEKEMLEGSAYAEAFMHRGMERECYVREEYDEDDHSASIENDASNDHCEGDAHEPSNDSPASDENCYEDGEISEDQDEDHRDFVVVNVANEKTCENGETILVENPEEAEVFDVGEDEEVMKEEDEVTHSLEAKERIDRPVPVDRHIYNNPSNELGSNQNESKGEEYAGSNDVINTLVRPVALELEATKPSDALKAGMSTALVVRQPTGHTSLPLQIWDLIRRIVGLGRTPSYRTQSEGSTNIMIV